MFIVMGGVCQIFLAKWEPLYSKWLEPWSVVRGEGECGVKSDTREVDRDGGLGGK